MVLLQLRHSCALLPPTYDRENVEDAYAIIFNYILSVSYSLLNRIKQDSNLWYRKGTPYFKYGTFDHSVIYPKIEQRRLFLEKKADTILIQFIITGLSLIVVYFVSFIFAGSGSCFWLFGVPPKTPQKHQKRPKKGAVAKTTYKSKL